MKNQPKEIKKMTHLKKKIWKNNNLKKLYITYLHFLFYNIYLDRNPFFNKFWFHKLIRDNDNWTTKSRLFNGSRWYLIFLYNHRNTWCIYSHYGHHDWYCQNSIYLKKIKKRLFDHFFICIINLFDYCLKHGITWKFLTNLLTFFCKFL